ncbi:MAG: MBL fold metallo-hydrolase [Rhodospirillaceae bacterium]
MIFRQFFDHVSSTYTYLLARRRGGEALLIDPVLEQSERYLKLLRELDLRLVRAVDTHCHADHITALGRLRDATRCVTVMGMHLRPALGAGLHGDAHFALGDAIAVADVQGAEPLRKINAIDYHLCCE